MNKSQIIDEIAKKLTHVTLKDLNDSSNLILEYMSDTLSNGDRIEIRGFGSFSLHYHPPRKARNPKSGATLMTEAKYSPHFKPGKEMRVRINDSAKTHEIKDED
jgi:integration host factor subunit beta